jgi:hypothetical protein
VIYDARVTKKTKSRKVPAAFARYLAAGTWKSIDGKNPPFIPMFSAESRLTLQAVREATDDFGDREDVLETHPDLWPLAWLKIGRSLDGAFVGVDGSDARCPVVLWWPETGDLVPMADSLDAYVTQLASPVAKAKRATMPQLRAAYRKADKLSDVDKNEAALKALDAVLAGFTFTPTVQMMLADDLIEWVGCSFKLRGTIAVLGPPYARETAIADSERDFRTAITWLSLGLSNPAFAHLGLCETLVYEAKDFARGIDEAKISLKSGKLRYENRRAYVEFFITKAKAFAELASGDVATAKKTYADAIKRAKGGERHFPDELREDFDKLDADYPDQKAIVKKLRAAL